MTKAELEERAGRRAPTENERRLAARIIVNGDKARGVKTPQWIVDLAKAS